MSFWREIERHTIYEACPACANVTRLPIRVAVAVSPSLPLPKWTISFMVFLFILGFPFAPVIQVFVEMSGAERLNKLKTTYNRIKTIIIFDMAESHYGKG
jgi:hypothetical protein